MLLKFQDPHFLNKTNVGTMFFWNFLNFFVESRYRGRYRRHLHNVADLWDPGGSFLAMSDFVDGPIVLVISLSPCFPILYKSNLGRAWIIFDSLEFLIGTINLKSGENDVTIYQIPIFQEKGQLPATTDPH